MDRGQTGVLDVSFGLECIKVEDQTGVLDVYSGRECTTKALATECDMAVHSTSFLLEGLGACSGNAANEGEDLESLGDLIWGLDHLSGSGAPGPVANLSSAACEENDVADSEGANRHFYIGEQEHEHEDEADSAAGWHPVLRAASKARVTSAKSLVLDGIEHDDDNLVLKKALASALRLRGLYLQLRSAMVAEDSAVTASILTALHEAELEELQFADLECAEGTEPSPRPNFGGKRRRRRPG